jgi:hypothetical protein
MGMSLGGAYGQTNQSATGSSNQSNTYAQPQTSLQTQLGTSLSKNLASADAGTLSPGTAAMKTSAADQINKTSSGLTDRVNSFLAQRGFGSSGMTGKTTLEGELGRESALGQNEANFAGMQQGLNAQNLLAALNYAFTSLGSSAFGQSTGNTSQWGVKAVGVV